MVISAEWQKGAVWDLQPFLCSLGLRNNQGGKGLEQARTAGLCGGAGEDGGGAKGSGTSSGAAYNFGESKAFKNLMKTLSSPENNAHVHTLH